MLPGVSLRLRAGVGVGHILPPPSQTPTLAKTVDSDRLQLWSRLRLRSHAHDPSGIGREMFPRSCDGLSESTVPFLPQSNQPFSRKYQNSEVTIDVYFTRMKGHHRRLSQWLEPSYNAYRLTKFESNPSFGLACTTD